MSKCPLVALKRPAGPDSIAHQSTSLLVVLTLESSGYLKEHTRNQVNHVVSACVSKKNVFIVLKSADDGTFQLQVKSDQTINRCQITLLLYSLDKLRASTADPADLRMHSVFSKVQSSL